jgi:HlyD family secretion protein
MKKRTVIILISILVIGVAGWYFFFRTKEKVTTYITERPVRGHIAETVTATGTIQPVDTVAVGTQVSGTVKKIYVDYNSVVKKGQLLAELDQALFQAAVDQAKGNLAQQQSQLVYQQGNMDRQTQLYKVGAISKADYDNAVYTYNSAKAAVSSQEASLHTAEKNLALSSIYSPINGTVLSRNVSEGQTVAASFNTPTLFTIAKDLTKMQVRASVDEADIGNVKDSERATFTVDAFLNDVFNGTVQEIRLSPSTAANVVTYTTIINAPNSDLKLKPGMTASVIIYTKEADSALLLSEKALKYNPDPASLPKGDTIVKAESVDKNLAPNEGYVWVMQGHQLIQKKVKIGLDDNIQFQVLDGLSPNDKVITGEDKVASGERKTQQASSPFMPRRRSRGGKK